jgi:acyl carrier protein
MATVYERVRKVASAQLGITDAEINAESNFTADLDADSLDMVEMMMALEDEFSIHGKKIAIPDEESEKMFSVQDIVDYLHSIGISDIETPKSTDKNNPQQTGTRKPGLPRPSFKHPWPQRQNKGATPQNKQQNSTAIKQQHGSTNQPHRDNRTPNQNNP